MSLVVYFANAESFKNEGPIWLAKWQDLALAHSKSQKVIIMGLRA
jgi:hypothetical protein